jgi:hypothetical protein
MIKIILIRFLIHLDIHISGEITGDLKGVQEMELHVFEVVNQIHIQTQQE